MLYRMPSKEIFCELLESMKEKRGRRRTESLCKEIMAEKPPNLKMDLTIQVHETYRSPNRHNLKRSSPTHIIINCQKSKRESLESRKELVSYPGSTVWPTHLLLNVMKAFSSLWYLLSLMWLCPLFIWLLFLRLYILFLFLLASQGLPRLFTRMYR